METPPPPVESTNAETSSMSLTDRLTDIFFSPNTVFDDIKSSPPKTVNWLLPLILSMILGVVSTIVIFSQPVIVQRLLDQIHQKQALQFQKMIKAGKLTEKQADDAREQGDRLLLPIMRIAGPIAAPFTMAAWLFGVALVAWLLAHFAFHSPVGYMKAVEFTGLSTVVAVVGGLVTTFLIVSYGDMMATSGPALLISHLEPTNKLHVLLSRLDVFQLWFIGLVACGIARTSGARWFKPALWLYGLWGAFVLFAVAVA